MKFAYWNGGNSGIGVPCSGEYNVDSMLSSSYKDCCSLVAFDGDVVVVVDVADVVGSIQAT